MVNPIPKFAKNVWSKWNIRGVILVSLSLQIILIFLAPFRKRSRRSLLVLLLWSTYLVADFTATFCVGLISNKYGDQDTPISTVNDFLLAFWTPFLLLHLGGPDTITAFALEDNELWLRHMLQLSVQVCLTAYVFLLTLPENTLWIPTALVFIAGIFKFAERTRSLQLASVSYFRQSIVRKPDPGPNYAKLMDELKSRQEAGLPTEVVTMPEISDEYFYNEPESSSGIHPDHDDEVDGDNTRKQSHQQEQTSSSVNARDQPKGFTHRPTGSTGSESEGVDGTPPIDDDEAKKIYDEEMKNDKEVLTDVDVVKGAYDYFKTFKGLVVDMIFSFHERSGSRNYLLERTALDALRVIEVELNFIYQAFYTKSSVITNWVGLFFRSLSVASLVTALVVFVYDQKHGCEPFDVTVTYTLLYGAVALDVVSVFMLVVSDHSFASIYSLISQKISDSDGGGKETFRIASILSYFLKLKRPIWIEKEIKKPKWFKNKRYSILCRWMLFRRWSESISGFNLISYCVHKSNSPQWLDKIIDCIGLKEMVEQWKYEKKQALLQRLWIFIFTELKRKSLDADDVETIQRICSSRGEWVLQEGELTREDLDKLMPYVERNKVTFEQCLILWHIATDLLFYEKKDNEGEKEKKENAPHDEQNKNEDARDLEKGRIGDDDAQKKNENDALDVEKGGVDGKKKNEIAQDDVKKESGDGKKKNEIPESDGGKRNSEIAQDGVKKESEDAVKKNEIGQDDGKKRSDGGKRKSENGGDDFEDVDELRHFCKLLSEYMLYLVIMQPNMMSAVRGIAQIRFQDTCAEATNFFSKRKMVAEGEEKMKAQGEKRKKREDALQKLKTTRGESYEKRMAVQAKEMCNKLFIFIQKVFENFVHSKEENEKEKSEDEEACLRLGEVNVEHEPSAVKGDRSKSVLFDGCKLGAVINNLKLEERDKWKMIAQVWVELLSYAAANCIPITHVQQLSKGGEFLSLVWLLMTHLGLGKQFQIKEGHARVKLIVGEEEEIARKQ